MKNIHLIPTDKPSRLVKNINSELKLTIQTLPKDDEIGCYPQHIYITSDEEIKDGDWFLVVGGIGLAINTYHKSFGGPPKNDWLKKIILTTDQDLINDGIQAIDDEFLEWFVKNPSCEFVKFEREKSIGYTEDRARVFYGKLKIIIPQEEPKQECECKRAYINVLSGICSLCWNERFPDEKEEVKEADLLEPKQETLEEHNYLQGFINQFEEGGEHQEISNDDWTVSQFLKWLKLNNFKIVKNG